jgi:hypothetical protein
MILRSAPTDPLPIPLRRRRRSRRGWAPKCNATRQRCPPSSTAKPATRALEVGPQHLPAFHPGEIHRLTFVLDRKIDGLSAVFHQAPQCGMARQTRLRVLVKVQPVTNAWPPTGRCKRVIGDGFRSQGPPPTGQGGHRRRCTEPPAVVRRSFPFRLACAKEIQSGLLRSSGGLCNSPSRFEFAGPRGIRYIRSIVQSD